MGTLHLQGKRQCEEARPHGEVDGEGQGDEEGELAI